MFFKSIVFILSPWRLLCILVLFCSLLQFWKLALPVHDSRTLTRMCSELASAVCELSTSSNKTFVRLKKEQNEHVTNISHILFPEEIKPSNRISKTPLRLQFPVTVWFANHYLNGNCRWHSVHQHEDIREKLDYLLAVMGGYPKWVSKGCSPAHASLCTLQIPK